MSKFKIVEEIEGWIEYEVEAENEDQALEKFIDNPFEADKVEESYPESRIEEITEVERCKKNI